MNSSLSEGLIQTIEQADGQSKKKLLDEAVEEWEAMKPALMRVVALEQDMQFLLQSMSEVNSVGPVYGPDNNYYAAAQMQDDLSSAPEIKYETSETKLDFVDGDSLRASKFSSTGNLASNPVSTKSSSVVAVLPAPKLSALKPLATDLDNHMDTKFSNQTAANEPAIKQSTQLATSNLKKSNNGCGNYSSNIIGQGSAVHLVSYKSKQLLLPGSQKLSKTFAEVLCGKMPLVKQVEVNGSTFYSMRFGPFQNKQSALQACSNIKKTGQYCGVTQFDGEKVL